jgi:hypothetical protein
MMPMLTKRRKYDTLWSELDSDYKSFEPQYRDINDYLLPTRARFSLSQKNRGDRRNLKIIDSTGTVAIRDSGAGMMGGITNPSRPWFRLTTPDPELAEMGSVKEWLHTATQRMNAVYSTSNFYHSCAILYPDLLAFGTAAMIIEEDEDDTIYTECFPVGQFRLGKSGKGRINVFMREYSMTVRQLVETFGETDKKTGQPMWDNFSTTIKNLWDRGNYESWVDGIRHVIAPNDEYDSNALDSKYKKFASCTYESASEARDANRFLRERGYDLFPILAPRWQATAEDVYSTSYPGVVVIGDVKQLQNMKKNLAIAVEKMVMPPMKGPAAMRKRRSSILPRDMTYTNSPEKYEPAHEVRLPIGELREEIRDTRDMIRQGTYANLFLKLSYSDRREITAEEIKELRSEKYLALGQVYQGLEYEFLSRAVDLVFEYMRRQGKIPKPPREIQGTKLRVEFISVMAQAQKLSDIGGLDRLAQHMLTVHPDPADPARDKWDAEQHIDELGNVLGVPPRVIRSDDKVEEIRSTRQQAVAAAQEAEQVAQHAKAAKDLGSIPMNEDTALSRMAEMSQAGAPS